MDIEGLEILRWAHGGDAVAVPAGGPLAGRVVFVPGAVPGDVVTGRVVQRKARWARVRLLRVERPSPERVDPPCPVQAACGGCPWMAGSARAQAASRRAILEGEARKRLGWTEAEAAARVSLAPGDEGPRLGYRVRVRMAWRVDAGGRVALGYRAAGSHRLVDVPTCVVADPRLQAALPEVRRRLAAAGPGEGEVRLVAGAEGVAGLVTPSGAAPWRLGPDAVTVDHDGVPLAGGPETFLQANPAVAAALSRQVEAEAAALAGGAAGGTLHAVELFAGSGTLTLPLLRAGLRVTAYEGDPRARAAFEAATAGRGDATWHRADLLAAGVPLPAPDPPDLVLLDPPRAGADALMPWVRGSGARLVVMVSCDVATALRDLATLEAGGAWRVASLTGYDMFPHTGHQEVVAVARPVTAGR